MGLTVCMIVKNEEAVLGRCLDSIENIADEIVIVDTGSTDRTKHIALGYTDRVYDFDWCDDFSKARNFSFSLASCDYIMWLDADDVVGESESSKIKSIIEGSPLTDIFMCKYAMMIDGVQRMVYYRERIFRRSQNYIWQGFVHEAIVPAGNVLYADITVSHMKIGTGAGRRNLDMYQRRIKSDYIMTARDRYYYARELYYNNRYAAAIKEVKKYLRMENKFLANEIDAYLIMAQCYISLKDNDKALKSLHQSLTLSAPSAEVCCVMGGIWIERCRYSDAVFWYETALLSKDSEEMGAFVSNEYCTIIPYLQLSYLHYKIGNFANAKKYYLIAKDVDPSHDVIRHNKEYFE